MKAFVAAALTAAIGVGASAATSKTEPWGSTQAGKPVERVTLTNDRGMALSYIDFGATITALEVPDRQGHPANVVLGLPDLAAYEHNKLVYGAIVGRYAGRIGNGHFTLDGREIQLPAAPGGNALHSGPDGFNKRVWTRTDFSDKSSLGSVFRMSCPEGDQGYPGHLDVEVTYRLLKKRNVLRIEYRAWSDAPTEINLTNHGYFNLAGAGASGVDGQRLTIAADRVLETDGSTVPTGRLLPASGTLDFRHPAAVAERLAALAPAKGFDHGYALPRWNGRLAKAVTLEDPASGRKMEIRTTEPSVQFYSGNGFDGSEGYRPHDGLAFETQHFPDSPNHANFPTTELRPGQVFRSVTTYSFTTLP